jgi:hypothetical protein
MATANKNANYQLKTGIRAGRTLPVIETVEQRCFLDAVACAPDIGHAPYAQDTANAIVMEAAPLRHVAAAEAQATTASVHSAKRAAATVQRSILSVVTLKNDTNYPITYQFAWAGRGTWSTITLKAGKNAQHWVPGRGLSATVVFDADMGSGLSARRYSLYSKPFVAGGIEGAAVRSANDGMVYEFENAGSNRIDLYSRSGLDKSRFSSMRAEVRKQLPTLADNFEIIATSSAQYNCIAWSVGETNTWYSPNQFKTLTQWDSFFLRRGFVRQPGLNTRVQRGIEKVALYSNGREYTHAAVQNPDGTWTSKLGNFVLIRHTSADVFRGTIYGTVAAVYYRLI